MRRHLREYPLGARHLPGTPRRLRKRQGECRGTRAGCANAKANATGLAQAAQTSRQMLRDLRGLRKRQSKRRETRAGCANAKANAGNPARPAQTSRQTPGTLRGLRDQTRINPAPRGARGGGAARRPYGCFRARCGRARAAAGCRGRKNAGRGCRTCRLARRP